MATVGQRRPWPTGDFLQADRPCWYPIATGCCRRRGDADYSAGPVRVRSSTTPRAAPTDPFTTMKPLRTAARQLNWVLAHLGMRLVRTRPVASDQHRAKETIIRYSNFSIRLPGDHKLPAYQARFSRYDRFLPHLAKSLDAGDVVVDVGANCGDTLAGMVDSNPGLRFLCIEPDDVFFAYLSRNRADILAVTPNASISLVKALVGKAVTRAVMEGVAGTKHAIPVTRDHTAVSEEAILETRLLDDIVEREIPRQRVRLLKSDVDGYDWDVLDSAEHVLERDHPLLYFECQCEDETQRDRFEETLEKLIEQGYEHLWFFDNFGEVVLRTNAFDVAVQLIDYVWRQNMGAATRTIYYYDVLACTPGDERGIRDVVEQYVAKDLRHV